MGTRAPFYNHFYADSLELSLNIDEEEVDVRKKWTFKRELGDKYIFAEEAITV